MRSGLGVRRGRHLLQKNGVRFPVSRSEIQSNSFYRARGSWAQAK